MRDTPRHPRHADLVAHALGRLEGVARERVEAAAAADPAVEAHLERVTRHLALYAHLPDAPPPPPFARVARGLDAQRPGRVARGDLPRPARAGGARRPWAVGAAAAIVLAGLLLAGTLGEGEDPPPAWVEARVGPGIEVVRDGRRLLRVPVGGRRALALRAGDWLSAERPAEVELTGRARVVLDGGVPLRLDGPRRVALRAGRAWFEVEPGAFVVETPHGPVEVLGTVFEVDLGDGRLDVAVVEGRVRVAERLLEAGARLQDGGAAPAPGDWFRAPRIELAHRGPGRVRPGAPLELDVRFANDGYVPVEAGGPRGLLSPLRLEVWRVGPDGARRGDALPLTIHAENVVSGRDLLEPGQPVILVARETRTLSVRLRSPFLEPGRYRLRAWYGAEGGSTPSNLLEIEARR